MKKIIFLLTITLMLFSASSFSQQDPQYTHYMYNMNVVNPAYAGSRETLSLGVLGRTQWVGLDGAPKTLTVNAHLPVTNRNGLGISVIADKIGPVKEQNAYVDFSHTIKTSENGNLAFGLKGGFTFFDANLLNVNITDDIDINDPLFAENFNGTYPNIGAGIYYYTDKFYASLAIPNILETPHLDHIDFSKASEKAHGFLSLGYVFEISENIDFKPATNLKATIGSPLSVDLTANLLFNKNLELGLAYRFDDSIDALISLRVNDDFRVGYSYDYTLSNLGDFNNGSHEIFLQYDVNFSRENIDSPRFF